MDGHWTYRNIEGDDLEQGDFLLPTDELREVLKEVHPHFCDDKYIGFVVTTQTCDLVRRKEQPKTQYINIATVRSLRETSALLFETIVPAVSAGIFRKNNKGVVRDFLNRLFNQNEQSLGLFYLHKDPSISLGDSSIAYLRVTVALKSDHYAVLMKARTGRLATEFQAKLGWLIGNLYSRAATPDWSEQHNGKNQLEELIQEHLDEQIGGLGPYWIEDKLVEAGISKGVNFDGRTFSELMTELEEHQPQPVMDVLTEQVAKEAKGALGPNPPEQKKIDAYIDNANNKIIELISSEEEREEVLAKVQAALDDIKWYLEASHSISDEKLRRFTNRIKNNSKVRKTLRTD